MVGFHVGVLAVAIHDTSHFSARKKPTGHFWNAPAETADAVPSSPAPTTPT
tara:strand:- start:185 stop:337 length:153 start_codon:yes stop_codon:yes gene_type:complete